MLAVNHLVHGYAQQSLQRIVLRLDFTADLAERSKKACLHGSGAKTRIWLHFIGEAIVGLTSS